MGACGPGRVLDLTREGGNLALVVREGVIMGRLLMINTVMVAQNLTIGSHGLRLDSEKYRIL